MSKKVGIVIPSFNQDEFLERAIKSVIANMKHCEISMVVMDGGSSDSSVDIIKKYERYISYWQTGKDSGQAWAINQGVKYLKDCDYIMWLNSDDEYESETAVKSIAEFSERHDYRVCYGKSYFIDRIGNRIGEYPTIPYQANKLKVYCFLSQPSVLVERKIWVESGGLDERLKMCLDYEMWIRLSKKYEFGYLEDYIGNTRMYEETKTATMQETHINEGICILKKNFGDVAIRWIYSKWLIEHNSKGFNRLIDGFLKVALLFFKSKYINEAMAACDYR